LGSKITMARTKQTVYAKDPSPVKKTTTTKSPPSIKKNEIRRNPASSIVNVPSPDSSIANSSGDGGRICQPCPPRTTNEAKITTATSSSAVLIVKCSKCGSRQARKGKKNCHGWACTRSYGVMLFVVTRDDFFHMTWCGSHSILLLTPPSSSLGCGQNACLACCEDMQCEVHKESRDLAKWREMVLAGKTSIQQKAKEKRSKLLRKGRFRESEFVYLGDTIMIWNIHDYTANPKWKDDALRKASRRNARAERGHLNNHTNMNNNNNENYSNTNTGHAAKPKKNATTTTTTNTTKTKANEKAASPPIHHRRIGTCRARFHRIMDDLYQQSLKD
jgi:hypothetical protein